MTRILKALFLLCLSMLAAGSFGAVESARKNIVFVGSYHDNHVWTGNVRDAFEKVLRDAKIDADFRNIYLDSKNVSNRDVRRRMLAEMLKSGAKADVVVAADLEAAEAIIDVCGLTDKEITMSDIVFKIGPRINASGRIQKGKEAVDLLIEKDYKQAHEKGNLINGYNEQRKDLDKSMTEEANKIVDSLENLSERRSIVIYNEEWHKGVIGIVASRLTEIYYRPAVVLTRTEGLATGSARSVSGFDVYSAIENCRDLLENFGGHTYAAGLSMKVENVEEFTRRFEEYVTNHILPEQTSATIDIDAQLDFRDITPKFFFDLKKFNPFGPENHKPVFATLNVYDYGTSKVVGREQEHIKMELVDNKSNNVMNGIAFGQSSQVRYIKTKQSFNICYTIEENSHKRGDIQLQIEDIKPSGF